MPTAVLVILGLIYNWIVFNSPFRDGYNYWCPVPFDVGLTFGVSYFKADCAVIFNQQTLLFSGMLLLVIALIMILPGREERLRKSDQAFDLGCFSIMFLLPLMALHLFYFCDDHRFALPLQVMLALNAGSAAGFLFSRIPDRLIPALQVALLVGAFVICLRTGDPIPYKRLGVEAISEYTSKDAVVITAIEPVYFSMFPKLEGRTFVPLHRGVEYASKLVAPHRIKGLTPGPISPTDHRFPGLVAAGAIDPVCSTADESLKGIKLLLQHNVPVYLDTSLIYDRDRPAVDLLNETFDLVQLSPSIYRLKGPRGLAN